MKCIHPILPIKFNRIELIAMNISEFIGRQQELRRLESIYGTEELATIAVTDRRRIGKTSLLLKFTENKRSLYFTFFKDDTADSNLREIRMVVSGFLKRDIPPFETLTDALSEIAKICAEERTVVVFDEYPFLAESCKAADSMLQRFIDVEMRDTDCMLVVCGSSVRMMNDHVYSAAGPLYNRFRYRMKLEGLPPSECLAFHPGMPLYDQARIYMTVGGIPHYHSLMKAETYERCLCECFFSRDSPLQDETRSIMELELSPFPVHSAMMDCIAHGMTRQADIVNALGISKGLCSTYLAKMRDLGFVDSPEPMLRNSKKAALIIEDGLIAFWYGVVKDRRSEMETDSPERVLSRAMPAISAFLDRRFELMVKDYMVREYHIRRIGKWIGAVEKEQTDIDVAAEAYDDRDSTVILVFECKFAKTPMGFSALNRLESAVKAAGCTHDKRLALTSGSGFSKELEEWTEDRGEPWLVGLEKIFGLESPDELWSDKK